MDFIARWIPVFLAIFGGMIGFMIGYAEGLGHRPKQRNCTDCGDKLDGLCHDCRWKLNGEMLEEVGDAKP
jgi:hypothetical protein